MIFDCSDQIEELGEEFIEQYNDKFRDECRICTRENEDLSFHIIDDKATVNTSVLLCEECHDLFCDDLTIDKMATSESTLVGKIQEYEKVSDTMLLNKIHGNNYQANGLPDFIGHIKGKYIGLETKTYDNNPSMIQAYQIKQIQKTGGKAFACYSVEQFYSIIDYIRED